LHYWNNMEVNMADEVASSRVDHVGSTGIYPASGPRPPGEYLVRGQGELGHPEEHARLRARMGQRPGSTDRLMAGRLLVGGYFLYSGINHFRNLRTIGGYARSKHVPAPEAAVIGSGVVAALGGLSVLTGVHPKAGASLIATFLMGVTPMIHDFWRVEDPAQRTSDFGNFTKNMALLGATCFIAAVPEPWPLSLRKRSEALVAA
jgi:putative oxidoreductase